MLKWFTIFRKVVAAVVLIDISGLKSTLIGFKANNAVCCACDFS